MRKKRRGARPAGGASSEVVSDAVIAEAEALEQQLRAVAARIAHFAVTLGAVTTGGEDHDS